MLEKFKWTAKAVAGGVLAALTYLLGVLGGHGHFTDVTTSQWLELVIYVLASYGVVFSVPNGKGKSAK